MRILVCLSVVAVIAIPAASGCRTEQKGTFSPSTKGAPTSTVKGDEIAVRSEGNEAGPPPITQISVVAGTGADKAGFEYAPPLDPHPALSGEEAVAQAWERGFAAANKPSSVSAVLANVTWGDDSDYLRARLRGRDVWVVTYPDACNWLFGLDPSLREESPAARQERPRPQAGTNPHQSGPDDSGVECFVQSFSSIIDAKTGEWYTSFTPGSSLG